MCLRVFADQTGAELSVRQYFNQEQVGSSIEVIEYVKTFLAGKVIGTFPPPPIPERRGGSRSQSTIWHTDMLCLLEQTADNVGAI
ncbi:hypothetical protein N826_39090 [Skermanella aerolata KACC 11604]|nr:hypothetical protein N826_39090 [Skermanella aerolata KACC 11604]